jgi:hypothetical protein
MGKEAVIGSVTILSKANGIVTIGQRTAQHITYAVVDENGVVRKSESGMLDLFDRKESAVLQAEYLNSLENTGG